jgi:UDP-N-acetylmuramoyl-L-alanyl-D-glutamate--2,6-diaminopimelate ligase
MQLLQLANAIPDVQAIGDLSVDVTDVCIDSREVVPGSMFVAVPGLRADGHEFLEAAIARGSAAVAIQSDHEARWREVGAKAAGVLIAADTRAAVPVLAAVLHGHPAQRLKVIGVTGTDGKTSLCHLLAHVLGENGRRVGLISTAESRVGDRPLPATGRFTTPEAPQVQSMLAEMVAGGCDWAIIEATSHGLALHRVDECEYDIAVMTNLGTDHLDFHGSAAAYRDAKGRLFRMLDEGAQKGVVKTAVLNKDDPSFEYFARSTRARVLSYGCGPDADVRAGDYTAEGWRSRFTLYAGPERMGVVFPRRGMFNVYNALAAVCTTRAAGLDLSQIASALESWPGAPGRMELIEEGQPFTVLVDFAHAPDSLRRVLTELQEMTPGRVIVVFGSIGERDKERRGGMARVAAEIADYTIVTDDNPYSEDRDAILGDIARAMRETGKRDGHDFAVVADRREAIAQAIGMAVDEDGVLLAGKGHETRVYLAGSSYPCDDREVARKALRELGHQELRG